MWPYGQQPTRLLCSWNSLSKNTGVGCQFLLHGCIDGFLPNVLTICLIPVSPSPTLVGPQACRQHMCMQSYMCTHVLSHTHTPSVPFMSGPRSHLPRSRHVSHACCTLFTRNSSQVVALAHQLLFLPPCLCTCCLLPPVIYPITKVEPWLTLFKIWNSILFYFLNCYCSIVAFTMCEFLLYSNYIYIYIYIYIHTHTHTHVCVCAWLLSHVWLFVHPLTVARQAPLSMGFSRQEYWSGLLFPSLRDLCDPGIKSGSPV